MEEQHCNYCDFQGNKGINRVNGYEDMYSLGKWANGSYCSLKCVSDDIEKHGSLINYYNNEIKSINHELGHSKEWDLLEKEVNKLKNNLDESLSRRTVLMQKLTCMKSLKETGKLTYKDI